jgi:hypothetical protein
MMDERGGVGGGQPLLHKLLHHSFKHSLTVSVSFFFYVSSQVHDLAGSICVEYNEVHKRAKESTKGLLIEAFDVSAAVRPMLMPVLSELIKRREQDDMQNPSRIAHHSTKLKHATKKGKGKDGKDEDEEQERTYDGERGIDEVDYDTTLLPDTDVFLEPIKGDSTLVNMEDDYWEKFDLHWEGHDIPTAAGPATVACLSYNNRFLFTGHKEGAVLFWDCAHDEPLLIRQDLRKTVDKKYQTEVVEARFGSGGGGLRVVCLDKAHMIRLWTTEVDTSGASSKKKKGNPKMFPKDYHMYAKNTKAPQLILVLSAKNFARPGQNPKDLTSLEPSFVCFHTAMTITGQTPSLMVGLRGKCGG